ncbi:MAG: hypothetical protein ACI4XK_02005 [Bacilli bacterium]
MKDKKIIILSIIGSLLLVSIAIASSYAYFVANVSGNKDTNNVVVTNGVMALEYKDGDAINLGNAIPGSSVSKTFTVKNTGNVSTNYTIYFSELSNKFVDKTDLVYTLTSSDGGKNVAQTQVPSTNAAMVSNYAIDAGKTHTYTLTITFLNKDENQNDNMNVSFSTKVSINETKEYVTTFAEQIADLAKTDTTNIATDDPDNNIRYIGANPNNYVYFNCSDYSNQSDSTCEKWRIIGVFKNVTKEDGSKADLVKIVKDDSLGNIMWDYKKNGVGTSTSDIGSNDWTDSQLMMMLNPTDYLKSKSGYTIDNNIVKDSNGQAIYKNMGSYYNGTIGCKPAAIASGAEFTCTSIDFTSTGLKNDLTRNAIESVVWNLGGTASYTSSSNGLASHWYGYERGTTVYSGHAPTWTGKIGLMYPSDYGYATSGGSTTDRAACLAKEMYNWKGSDVSDCKNNDYLYKSGYYWWTLAPTSSGAFGVFTVYTVGFVGRYSTDNTGEVRPVAFLKSNISITNVGTGTSESPFQLKVG